MWLRRRLFSIKTARTELRLPVMKDHAAWVRERRASEDFLRPWEPAWTPGQYSRKAFGNRVYFARRSFEDSTGLVLFIFRRSDKALLGSLTCKNIRKGSARCATLGYWVGKRHARKGFMSEALRAVVDHAFGELDLSRLEAACLPENAASRRLLERAGFREEGLAEAYLQIGGRWRTHVLYSLLRADRREGGIA